MNAVCQLVSCFDRHLLDKSGGSLPVSLEGLMLQGESAQVPARAGWCQWWL